MLIFRSNTTGHPKKAFSQPTSMRLRVITNKNVSSPHQCQIQKQDTNFTTSNIQKCALTDVELLCPSYHNSANQAAPLEVEYDTPTHASKQHMRMRASSRTNNHPTSRSDSRNRFVYKVYNVYIKLKYI